MVVLRYIFLAGVSSAMMMWGTCSYAAPGTEITSPPQREFASAKDILAIYLDNEFVDDIAKLTSPSNHTRHLVIENAIEDLLEIYRLGINSSDDAQHVLKSLHKGHNSNVYYFYRIRYGLYKSQESETNSVHNKMMMAEFLRYMGAFAYYSAPKFAKRHLETSRKLDRNSFATNVLFSELLLNNKDYSKAFDILNPLYETERSTNNPQGIFIFGSLSAKSLYLDGKWSAAERRYKDALKHASSEAIKSALVHHMARALNEAFRQKRADEARLLFKITFDQLIKLKNEKQAIKALITIGRNAIFSFRPLIVDKALTFAIRKAEALGDNQLKAEALFYSAFSKTSASPKEAALQFHETLEVATLVGDKKLIAQSLAGLASTFEGNKNSSKQHEACQRWNKAIDYAQTNQLYELAASFKQGLKDNSCPIGK